MENLNLDNKGYNKTDHRSTDFSTVQGFRAKGAGVYRFGFPK